MSTTAVIIPVYNEEKTVNAVMLDFWEAMKNRADDCAIYVIDNNSSDQTKEIVLSTYEQHAINGKYLFVKRQGKSNAIKEAFRQIEADVYVIVDGDSTYWGKDLEALTYPILKCNMDMVIGDRMSNGHYANENKRSLHEFGNMLVKKLINKIFKADLKDIMTGYRAFSRRFVKNYPILCEGFELETDMSIYALEHKFNICELPITYSDRPKGSESKLNTFRDGMKVIFTIFNLFRNYKPLHFFSLIGLTLLCIGLIAGSFPIYNYITMHYVTQIPMAILSVGLVVLSFLSFSIGIMLSTIRRYQNIHFEVRMLNIR